MSSKESIQRLKEAIGSESLVPSVVVDEAIVELERLRVIEGRTSKTRDGVVPTPRMALFAWDQGEVKRFCATAVFGTRSKRLGERNSNIGLEHCYSTMEAARQAKESP